MKKLFFLLALIAVCSFFIINARAYEKSKEQNRFKVAYTQIMDPQSQRSLFILSDEKTGIQYLFVKWGSSGGLCVLEGQ